MNNIAPAPPTNQSHRIPKALRQFFANITQKHPDNFLLFQIAFTPMEPEEWCLIWIPRIYPDIRAPLPGERKPLGYLAACQNILCFLTGYSDKTIQRWLDGDDCKPIIKRHLRLIHIFWTFQRFLKFPLAIVKTLEPSQALKDR